MVHSVLRDAIDKELAMSETVACVTVNWFGATVVEKLVTMYLQAPTMKNILQILKDSKRRGNPTKID